MRVTCQSKRRDADDPRVWNLPESQPPRVFLPTFNVSFARVMIVGLTALVIAISILIALKSETAWSMFSFLYRRSGTPSNAPHATDDLSSTQSKNSVEPTAKRSGASSQYVDGSPETTPKAKPVLNGAAVPQFSLNGTAAEDDSDEEDWDTGPPQFPALNSAQRAGPSSSIPQVPAFPGSSAKSSSMMPPPPLPRAPARPTNSLAPPPSAASSLRVPSTGPLPNRGPPTSSLSVMPTAPTSTPNPRQKVLLAPGHSPLDWAARQRSGENLAGVDGLLRVTPSLLRKHNGRKGRPSWASYQGKVYNIAPYFPYHPGGEKELRKAVGRDGEKLFMDVHPWVNWDNMLGTCLVGILVGENDPKQSRLDDLD
jgi:cytochrome b involved in lipid metabolism